MSKASKIYVPDYEVKNFVDLIDEITELIVETICSDFVVYLWDFIARKFHEYAKTLEEKFYFMN